MLPHFRGVVFPKPEGKLYRYMVMGLLVSHKPIPEFEGKNEVLLDGYDAGLSDTLPSIRQGKLKEGVILGDSNMVLTSLGEIFEEDKDEEVGQKHKAKQASRKYKKRKKENT